MGTIHSGARTTGKKNPYRVENAPFVAERRVLERPNAPHSGSTTSKDSRISGAAGRAAIGRTYPAGSFGNDIKKYDYMKMPNMRERQKTRDLADSVEQRCLSREVQKATDE
jgi:hypothetical protein